jgi:hypothetical protein
MATRAGVDYVIAKVREISGAGTAEYELVAQSGSTVTYFTDEQIEQTLDSRRIRLSRHQVVYEPELSGGSTVYQHAKVGFAWVEDESAGGTTNDMKITDNQGSVIGTADYAFSAEDGYLSFTANQVGSARFITGWVHNPYKAAVDILTSWLNELVKQPDFQTDNMRVWRSNRADAIRRQIEDLKEIAGMAPYLQNHTLLRDDISPSEWPEPGPKPTKIPTD